MIKGTAIVATYIAASIKPDKMTFDLAHFQIAAAKLEEPPVQSKGARTA